MERLKTRTARLRHLEELLLLKPGGIQAVELARQLRVDRRTVYRDLDFLSEQGVLLWGEDGVFEINRAHCQSTVRLTYHVSVALVLAALLLARNFDERNPYVISALRCAAWPRPCQSPSQPSSIAPRCGPNPSTRTAATPPSWRLSPRAGAQGARSKSLIPPLREIQPRARHFPLYPRTHRCWGLRARPGRRQGRNPHLQAGAPANHPSST